ncbi:MAG: phage terminase large subunit family protein [Alphaproteobacteria bacterium]
MTTGIVLRNLEHLVAATIAAVLPPPPPLDLNQWAIDNIVFGGESPYPGPYNPDNAPWNATIFSALEPTDPCRDVVLKGSAQFGKSVIGQVFCLGTVSTQEGLFLYTHPQDDNAKRWSRTKLRPMLRKSSALTQIFGPVSDQSLLYIERRDGAAQIQVSGARSESSLSMITARRQVQDDLAKWETNEAGDPEEQADSRSASVRNRKTLKASTPLIEPGCRITRAYKAGTREEWAMPCPHCGFRHPLRWENLLENLDEAHPEAAAFSCPDCGGLIEQHHLRGMRSKGRFVAGNPGAPSRSFYLWRALFGVDTFADIARKWLQVKGDPAAEQVFYNDWLGLAYEAAGQAPPAEALRDRAVEGHPRGLIPAGFPLLTIGVDVQGGDAEPRLECQVVAWGPDLRRAIVDYIVIEGHIQDDKPRKALDALLTRIWRNAAGGRVQADAMAVDANAYTEDVMDWVKRHPASKVIGIRGSNQETAPPLAEVKYERDRRGRRKRFGKRFKSVGVIGMKAAFYRLLEKTDPLSRGYVALPSGMEDVFFEGLTAERRVRQAKRGPNGQERWKWEVRPNTRNEPLDTMMYAEAAAVFKGWRQNQRHEEFWDTLCAEREAPVGPPGAQLDLEDLAVPAANAVRGQGSEQDGTPPSKVARHRDLA